MANIHLSTDEIIAADQSFRERAYWLEKLSGIPGKAHFTYDFNYQGLDQYPDNAAARFENITFKITGELFSRLTWIIYESDVRLHMILVAGLVLLLDKYTFTQDEPGDIMVGSPIYKQEMEGEFINTLLPLRYHIHHCMTFKEFLFQVKQTIEEAVEYQNYPLETLLYELHIPYNEDDEFPLYDTAILVENIHERKYLSHIRLNTVISFLRTETAIEGRWEYNRLRYDSAAVARRAAHFLHLLEELVFNVDKPLDEISLVSEEEKSRLLYEFNNRQQDYPGDKKMHELFLDQVENVADHVAVVGMGCGVWGLEPMVQLSYGELNTKSNQLACLLKEKGVRPDAIAALKADCSLEMVTGMLGILKTGSAYLPIDPAFPQERINYMLADSNAEILLTNQEIAGLVSPQALDNRPKDTSCHLHLSPAPATSLAYIIYTSGTTGRPKGVLIGHRGVVNLAVYHRQVFAESPGTRMSQVANPSFDAMAFEVWPCLLGGAALHIAPDDIRVDPPAMKQWLIKSQIDISFQSTIMGEQLLQEDWPEHGSQLRALRVAGDRLASYLEKNYPFQFYNLYGPTEDTVWTTWALVEVKPGAGKSPHIGKPVANHRVYILSPGLRLEPVGVPGELGIAGDGLARGYLNQPELTSQRFVSLLHRSYWSYKSNMSHIYKTRDLARWLSDGNIEFLGRIDNQVKIRGFRIELGEVENQLLQVEYIKEAVVLCRRLETPGHESSGNKAENYLCAYITTNPTHPEPDLWELTQTLGKHLPDYMIPSFFTKLEKIPLTANGKIDTNALPLPAIKSGINYIAPRNEIEKKLATLWGRVLKLDIETIGIDDNFFQLGGHSLKIAVLISKIHKEFNVNLPMADMFKMPTIRSLSGYIKESGERSYTGISCTEKREYYPLAPAQKRMYILQQMDLHHTGYNIPLVVPLHGDIDVEKLEQTFLHLIQRHKSLRTSYFMIDGEGVQKIDHVRHFAVNYDEAGERETMAITGSFVKPFDLAVSPQIRANLVKTAKDQYLLMTDMHHIAADGISSKIIMTEFYALYNGDALPRLRLQYKDYTMWLYSEKQQQAIKNQEEYWLNQFSGSIPELNLPLDFPRPEVRDFDGQSIPFEIGTEETRLMNNLVKSKQVTMFMILLAVYNILLAKLSGQEDIIVGTTLTGRRHNELENIVGMFVTTLPIRNQPEGEKTFSEFLSQLKDNTLAIFDHQDYPFEDLVRQVARARDSNRNPVFDVLFDFRGYDGGSGVATSSNFGNQANLYDNEQQVSKFDLILTGSEFDEKLFMSFEFRTQLFKRETVERFIDYFKKIVSIVANRSDIQLKDIDMPCELVEIEANVHEDEGDFGF